MGSSKISTDPSDPIEGRSEDPTPASEATQAGSTVEASRGRSRRGSEPVGVVAIGASLEGHEASCRLLVREDDFKQILTLLRAAEDIDFTLYRDTSVKRRILRRMVLHQQQRVQDYIEYLAKNPSEVEALRQDILIQVTQFFRDPEVFAALKEQVYPRLFKVWTGDTPIRIWVPGCSTGEEAYSIAISLLEVLSKQRLHIPFQIFATDVSEAAIARARAGIYLEHIAADVSAERLRRFFIKVGGGRYQISDSIRGMCVFARQNMLRDPPFSRLDLISCRNVLIYFEPALQKKILSVFHYALKSTGFLVLGSSETAGISSELFTAIDQKNKVHARAQGATPFKFDFIGRPHGLDPRRSERAMEKPKGWIHGRVDLLKEADKVIMGKYSPAGVIINTDLQIVHFRGHTGPYLEPAPGDASLNVLKMAREGIVFELRAAIDRSRRTNAPVRTGRLRIREGDSFREVNIEVTPLHDGRVDGSSSAADRTFLILFEETGRAAHAPTDKPAARERSKGAAENTGEQQITKLEQELSTTKEHLQAIIEEHEVTNEALQTANEELLSSNEELQSINEELEAAKEELESTNEELTSVNEELEHRNTDLNQLTDDLKNLLASVHIPIVMLGSDLRIRRFTPEAERMLNVTPSPLGRHISEIQPKISIPDLEQQIVEVIESVSIHEREVQDPDGRWYSLRIRPFRTSDNQIEGAVICLLDIDDLKRSLDGDSRPQGA
jgi:two-component system, chemotaxis family, CheB/CheR fusion protein